MYESGTCQICLQSLSTTEAQIYLKLYYIKLILGDIEQQRLALQWLTSIDLSYPSISGKLIKVRKPTLTSMWSLMRLQPFEINLLIFSSLSI